MASVVASFVVPDDLLVADATATQVAAAVRAELALELARIDVPISSVESSPGAGATYTGSVV